MLTSGSGSTNPEETELRFVSFLISVALEGTEEEQCRFRLYVVTLGISASQVGWSSFPEERNWLSLTQLANEPESTSDLEILQPYRRLFRENSVDQGSSILSFFKRSN